MADFQLTDDLRDEAKTAWFRYLEMVMPFRPDLYRYCRSLTQDLWDCEDLLQDTLLRGFARLGSIHHRIDNPRAYLVRTATNLWIDTQRKRGTERSALEAHANSPMGTGEAAQSPSESIEVREAAAAMIERLAPQERAAILLKDVFDMDLRETADVLGTTIGAVKAALHRGRSRLRQPDPVSRPARRQASRELVDRFVNRYNARDLPGLLALMLDSASIDLLGLDVETGREAFERRGGWFYRNLYGQDWAAERPYPARWQSALFNGEVVALVFSPNLEGREVLGSVMRLEEEGGHISSVRAYALCPETVREIGDELGWPTDPDPYRFISMILAFARGH